MYDCDETVSAEEVDLNLANPMLISTQIGPSENKTKPKSKSDDYSKAQEIISISSNSEQENAEQKIDNGLLWKSRPPKKCSKSFQKKYERNTKLAGYQNAKLLSKALIQTLLNPLVKLCCLRNHVFFRKAMNVLLSLCLLVQTI